MATVHVRWPDLKRQLTLATCQTHRIVIERPMVHRLEVEDTGGHAQRVGFSNPALWHELDQSHKHFAKNAREHRFDPEPFADQIPALRFLDANPRHRLLIVAHTDRRSADRAHDVLAMLEGKARQDQLRFVSASTKVLTTAHRAPGVELLFFEAPDIPDPSDARAPDLIYARNLFRFAPLDLGELAPADKPASPEEPLETRMPVFGEWDPADPWAFLEPFDAAHPSDPER